MLTKVVVDQGWHLWRPKDDPNEPVKVEPGEYYQVKGRIRAEHRDTFKNRMAPLAVTPPDGTFSWLLPYEKWVKVVYDGQLELPAQAIPDTGENRDYLADKLSRTRAFVDSLRNWQRRCSFDLVDSLESNVDYRHAVVVRVGGGKTLFGLLCASLAKEPVVLAPTYCWNTWQTEADKWGFKCPRLSTYQSAHKIKDTDCLILDEVLIVANPNTKVHNDALCLSKQGRTVVGLTGTPQSVSPMDLRWVRCIFNGAVPADEKPWRFLFGTDTALLEIKPGQKAYVTKTWDQEKVDRFTSPYITVVQPQEIVKELPEITYTTLTVPRPTQYDLIVKGAATERGKSKALAQARMCTDGCITDDNGTILARLNSEKLDAICAYVERSGEPAVIFARWRYMVEDLARNFGARASVLCGGSDSEAAVEAFRNGHTDVLIAQADLCQGMNLQERARLVIFASNSTRPVNREQAIGRVYRPGQKRGVVVVDVIAENTLDAVTIQLLNQHKDRGEAYIEAALMRELERQAAA